MSSWALPFGPCAKSSGNLRGSQTSSMPQNMTSYTLTNTQLAEQLASCRTFGGQALPIVMNRHRYGTKSLRVTRVSAKIWPAKASIDLSVKSPQNLSTHVLNRRVIIQTKLAHLILTNSYYSKRNTLPSLRLSLESLLFRS